MSQVQPSPWIAVGDRLPPEHQKVLVLLACPDVAIDAKPTVAHLQIEFRGTASERCDWWAGVPGKWMAIRPGDDWIVTHWSRLPEYDDFHRPTRAAAWDRWTLESPPEQLGNYPRHPFIAYADDDVDCRMCREGRNHWIHNLDPADDRKGEGEG